MPRYEDVGMHIMQTAHRIKVELNSVFANEELNGVQARILGFVAMNGRQKKDVYQKDIENEFKIRRSSVTSVLNTMEKNGYIERKSVLADARLKKVVLTEKAQKVSSAHHKSIERFEKSLVESMTAEEIQTLKILLSKVKENLNELRGE